MSRVFIRMAEEIRTREAQLREEVKQLRIQIDQAKKDKAITDILESDAFQAAKAQAQAMRERRTADTEQDSDADADKTPG
jgi:hypothetical protein